MVMSVSYWWSAGVTLPARIACKAILCPSTCPFGTERLIAPVRSRDLTESRSVPKKLIARQLAISRLVMSTRKDDDT